MQKRLVYFVSESTGITSSYLAKSLLPQFPEFSFETRFAPYINTVDLAQHLLEEWEQEKNMRADPPLVFATMADLEINSILKKGYCHYYEFFNTFIARLEEDLGATALHRSGLSHGLTDQGKYDETMDILNYAINHDDAIRLKGLETADIILLGVSRSGKTPTCLYLALQYRVRAANYPLTDDDFDRGDIPKELKQNLEKMIALRIEPERLSEIRQKRRPGSRYASLQQCQAEVRAADRVFQRYRLPVLNTTNSSIEELSSMIMNTFKLKNTNF